MSVRDRISAPPSGWTVSEVNVCGLTCLNRIWLRKALEKPDEWTKDGKIRAQYHLGKLLLSKKDQDQAEAERLLTEARDGKDILLEKYGQYLPSHIDRSDDAIYDHLVYVGAGRTTSLTTMPALTPKMDEICSAMKQKLETATANGKAVHSPGDLVQHLSYEEEFPGESYTGRGS